MTTTVRPRLHGAGWRRVVGGAIAAPLLILALGVSTGSASSSDALPVTACPIPPEALSGITVPTPQVPSTLRLPAAVSVGPGAKAFGTGVPGDRVYFALGPSSSTCSAGYGSADGGFSMSLGMPGRSTPAVVSLFSAGGVGPNTDLACAFIPAVHAADVAFRNGDQCPPAPASDAISQVKTGSSSLVAAVVTTQPGTKDPALSTSGIATDSTLALFVARLSGTAQASAQDAECTLPAADLQSCLAALTFFAGQSLISTDSVALDAVTAAIQAIGPAPAPSPPVGPSGSCTGGQMMRDASPGFGGWKFHYGISDCEGLVVSDVSLQGRLMAERMSLPYLNVQTCTPAGGLRSGSVADCGEQQVRHVVLRSDADETAQQATPLYTHVTLQGRIHADESLAPHWPPCLGRSPCDRLSIEADWRIMLSASAGEAGQWLDVTQRYEFYRDFSESDYPDLACEPSKGAPYGISVAASPLEDCGRWKPLVIYQYHAGSSGAFLVSVNAAERIHFTPDAMAVRASTLTRDCDGVAPQGNCLPDPRVGLAFLEVFPPTAPLRGFSGGENPIQHETVIRAVQASDAGTPANLPGRYDNVHLTPADHVALPLPIPPGCPECAHVHWRWGADVAKHADTADEHQFGDGAPLLGDDEPAAVGTLSSRQQLDVALVAYHSEELAPRNYFDLVQGANENQLDMHQSTHDAYTGGWSQGKETLDYPTGACFASYAPASWGQCGQVLWLSATTFTDHVTAGVGDEDNDTLFAFGGFFCGKCSGGYAAVAKSYDPSLLPSTLPTQPVAPGQLLRMSFSYDLVGTKLFLVLPPGSSHITVTTHDPPAPMPAPNQPRTTCAESTDAHGEPVVQCTIPEPPQPNPTHCIGTDPCLTVQANAPEAPGDYTAVVHAAWGSGAANTGSGGNVRLIIPVTVATASAASVPAAVPSTGGAVQTTISGAQPRVVLTAGGLRPDSTADITIHSASIPLGRYPVDHLGRLSALLTLPTRRLHDGVHLMTITGLSPQGKIRHLTAAITLTRPTTRGRSHGSVRWWWILLAAVGLGAGAVGLRLRHRRRSTLSGTRTEQLD